MPLIQCDGCGAVFKAGLDVVGKSVACPKCKHRFVATVKRAGPKVKESNTRMWVGVVGGVFLVLVVVIGITMSGKDEPNTPAKDTAAASSSKTRISPEPEDSPPLEDENQPPPPTQDELETVVNGLIDAIERADESAVARYVSTVQFHDSLVEAGLAQVRWADLDPVEQAVAREAVSTVVLGDDAGRDFLRKAQRTSFNVVERDSERAKVHLIHKSMTDADQQERTLSLRRFSSMSGWMVTAMQAGPIGDPVAMAAAAHKEGKERRAREREALQYGTIEVVEHLRKRPKESGSGWTAWWRR